MNVDHPAMIRYRRQRFWRAFWRGAAQATFIIGAVALVAWMIIRNYSP